MNVNVVNGAPLAAINPHPKGQDEMKQTLLIITALMLVFGCSNDGVITEYYENGQKMVEETYKDGVMINIQY